MSREEQLRLITTILLANVGVHNITEFKIKNAAKLAELIYNQFPTVPERPFSTGLPG